MKNKTQGKPTCSIFSLLRQTLQSYSDPSGPTSGPRAWRRAQVPHVPALESCRESALCATDARARLNDVFDALRLHSGRLSAVRGDTPPRKNALSRTNRERFRDSYATEKVEVEYPVGHRRRRAEGIPLLLKQFQANAVTCLTPERVKTILALFEDVKSLEKIWVNQFVSHFLVAA